MIPFEELAKTTHETDAQSFAAREPDPFVVVAVDPRRVTLEPAFQTLEASEKDLLTGRLSRYVVRVKKREGSNVFTSMITIGRATNNDVVVPIALVSKFHAFIRPTPTGWTIHDGSGKNGVLVNGEVVPRGGSLPIQSGATIGLGKAIALTFLAPRDLFALLRS